MILYGIDFTGVLPETAIERFFESFGTGEDLDPPPPYLPQPPPPRRIAGKEVPEPVDPPAAAAKRYAVRLVEGTIRSRAEIDLAIQKVSTHWRLERMARVDRNLLRLGTYELTALAAEVPRKVVINEAVEIAKRYGTAESSAFINGILDRVQK